MRKITGLLFVMTLFVSLSVCNAQTVDEIVNKYVDSLGGAAKIQSIKTVRMEATMSMMGNDIGIVITNSHLVGSRVDISFNGQDGYTIVTPTKGWSYLPFQGQTEPTPMPEEQLKIQQTSLDLQGNLFNYKEKGNQLELQGKEKLDGFAACKRKLLSVHSNFLGAPKVESRNHALQTQTTSFDFETHIAITCFNAEIRQKRQQPVAREGIIVLRQNLFHAGGIIVARCQVGAEQQIIVGAQ